MITVNAASELCDTLSTVSLRCPGPHLTCQMGEGEGKASFQPNLIFPCNLITTIKLLNMHRWLSTSPEKIFPVQPQDAFFAVGWHSSSKGSWHSKDALEPLEKRRILGRAGSAGYAKVISWVRKSWRCFKNILRNAMSRGVWAQSCFRSPLVLSWDLFSPVECSVRNMGCWWCHSQGTRERCCALK